MIANHVHDALAQVRTLQAFLIERNMFKGYSGTARILSGTAALGGAAVLALGPVPATPVAHLLGWFCVLSFGLVANYVALAWWFLFDSSAHRNPVMLKPALDAVPALAVGAVVTMALILRAQLDLLFGSWMCLYGLAQIAYRHSLPAGVYRTGLFYVLCGTWFLLAPGVRFLDPWPMGVVFFVGELAGGIVLVRDHRRAPRRELEAAA